MSPNYRAAWWLPGPHLPTLWGKVAGRHARVPVRRVRLDTPDGDFIDLYRTDAEPDAPRLLFLHGLEGTVRSHYVQGLFAEAARRGWGADLFVFRSCGDELNRLPRFYHSGETGDLSFVLDHLLAEFPAPRFGLAGFSLGGNVLLKWLGERGSAVPSRVRAAVAVSVPFDLDLSCTHVSQGFSRVYEQHFVRNLLAKAREKGRRMPKTFSVASLANVRSLRDFDNAVTAPLHGFRDAKDYYARSSSLGFLADVRLPTLLLNAVDDPFLPADVLSRVRAVARENSSLELEFVPHGGHVGFVSGRLPWRPFYYGDWRVADFLAQRLTGSVDSKE